MNYVFHTRFLLRAMGLLIVVLFLQNYYDAFGATFSGKASFSKSVGGPIEIARNYRDGLYYAPLIIKWLTVVLIEPCVVGVLVYSILRWRHPAYQVPIKQMLLLTCLTWWAWGLLSVVAYPSGYTAKFYYTVIMGLAGWVLAVIAARISYYRERTLKQ